MMSSYHEAIGQPELLKQAVEPLAVIVAVAAGDEDRGAGGVSDGASDSRRDLAMAAVVTQQVLMTIRSAGGGACFRPNRRRARARASYWLTLHPRSTTAKRHCDWPVKGL